MTLLNWIFNKKSPVQKKTTGAVKRGSNKAKANESDGELKSERASVSRRVARVAHDENNTIRRLDQTPAYEKVLSRENGEVAIAPQVRKDYIVLLSKKESNKVIIITSIEKSESSSGIDHIFLDIKQKCSLKGYKDVEKMYAPRQIIALIYESLASNGGNDQEIKDSESLQADFDRLLADALVNNVSDIHIEVRRNNAVVRYRINGSLRVINDWPVSYARNFAVVVYQVIAEEKEVTFIESNQQSAIIDRELVIDNKKQRVRVRLNTLPAYPDGFDMVMRLLRMGVSTKKATLNSLGYNDAQLKDINTAVSKPVGAIVIAGTTGSGKSTSLSTMISRKIEHHSDESGCRIKVITVEDPPENEIKNSTQVPVVRTRTGKNGKNPFAEAMKAALRSDPDIIMVGEVRDEDSTELLVHTVQSGHQAYTTIHTSSAIGIVSRLRGMGIKNDVLGSTDFFSGLIYQGLLPVTCKECGMTLDEFKEKNKDNQDSQELCQRINSVTSSYDREKIRFIRYEGCEHCVGGITGRTVVAEVIIPDKKMKMLFSEGKDTLALEYFLENGGKTILSHGIDKMKDGVCDPRDVEYKLGRLDDIHKERENAHSTKKEEEDAVPVKIPVNLDSLELESSLLSGKKASDCEGVVHKVNFGATQDKVKSTEAEGEQEEAKSPEKNTENDEK
jgi:type II secretory ATPase GspE/PulE/Tfp pilus assembly ATPase PilB-like protein